MIALIQPCNLTSDISFYSLNDALNSFLFISVALNNTASCGIMHFYLFVYSPTWYITMKIILAIEKCNCFPVFPSNVNCFLKILFFLLFIFCQHS